MIVVDASIIATALINDGDDGHRARAELVFNRLFAPEIIDLEVISVWRRGVRRRRISRERARQAVTDLIDLPLKRVSHLPLIGRVWELRENLTSYDAAYVALAESLEVPFLTADSSLSTAPGINCVIKVLGFNG